MIRYADDFLVTAKDKESLADVLIQLKQWMSSRGLEISREKTKIVQIDDGFNYLGFNLRHYNGKLLIKPQKEKVLDFCKSVGQKILSLIGEKQEVVIQTLNPILRGFANYYRGVVSKETFSYISHRIWRDLWRYAQGRHPFHVGDRLNKGKKWIKNRYFGRIKKRDWTFMCQVPGKREGEKNS